MASFAVVTIRPFREPVLRAAGWALVVNEPVEPADIIVVTVDSGSAGALEAADLVQSGIAKRGMENRTEAVIWVPANLPELGVIPRGFV